MLPTTQGKCQHLQCSDEPGCWQEAGRSACLSLFELAKGGRIRWGNLRTHHTEPCSPQCRLISSWCSHTARSRWRGFAGSLEASIFRAAGFLSSAWLFTHAGTLLMLHPESLGYQRLYENLQSDIPTQTLASVTLREDWVWILSFTPQQLHWWVTEILLSQRMGKQTQSNIDLKQTQQMTPFIPTTMVPIPGFNLISILEHGQKWGLNTKSPISHCRNPSTTLWHA